MAQPEPPEVPNLLSLDLPSKPTCPIKYTFSPLGATPDHLTDAILLVFVNGLGLPQAFWQPALDIIRDDQSLKGLPSGSGIFAATWDRYGQGFSQPPDGAKPEPHDLLDAVQDLHEVIAAVKRLHLANVQNVKLFLVGHSIGGPLTRLYCQHHPEVVSALLLLDSNLANSDFVSVLPDPDAPGFTPDMLPDDCTVEQLRSARAFIRMLFHPTAPNKENLDRSTVPELLPLADGPKLRGAGKESTMILSIVGHDPETFADESSKFCPIGLTARYTEPAWQKYNDGLLHIADNSDAATTKWKIAPGCGHFIQRDNPPFVAQEVTRILKLLV